MEKMENPTKIESIIYHLIILQMAPLGNPGQPDLGQAGREPEIQQLVEQLVEQLENAANNNFAGLNLDDNDDPRQDGEYYDDEYYAQYYDDDDDYRYHDDFRYDDDADFDFDDHGDLAPEDKGQPDSWPYSRGPYYGSRA